MKGKVLHLRAATETEAISRVAHECGPDAIIGEIRQVPKPGIAGLLGKREVEVSIRIKEKSVNPGDEIAKFKSLVNKIGQSIRADQDAGYFRQWEAAIQGFNIGGSLAEKILSFADGPCNPEALAGAIASSVKVTKLSGRVLALVGPTGAGKTTTIAKLAGINGYQLRKKVAIISLDTFRIGAVEQLRTYTRIMGIPLSVVSSVGELQDALARYSKYDSVYIDTTGRAPGNQLSLAELGTLLACSKTIETALVVSATTKVSDLLLASRGFARLSPSCAIVTKVDETASLGSVVTFIHQSGLPLACMGTGQAVPQDIQFADSGTISNWVLTENREGGMSIDWKTG